MTKRQKFFFASCIIIIIIISYFRVNLFLTLSSSLQLHNPSDGSLQTRTTTTTNNNNNNNDNDNILLKPSNPLCQKCLDVVQKASPVNLTFVDISAKHMYHPHKGAKHANFTYGYIHNETMFYNNPPPFTLPAIQLDQACRIRDNTFRLIQEKIFHVDTQYGSSQKQQQQKRLQRKPVKLFCLVYTTISGHKKIPPILETWGSKCDGFMVGSTKTVKEIGAANIPHEGPEIYDNIWQKVRSMWSYIYDHYYDKYDWFHIGGDDLYLIVENLKYYLESEEIQTASNGGIYLPNGTEPTFQTPIYLGRWQLLNGLLYNHGGGGYTLNKAALKLLVVEAFPRYYVKKVTFSEDTMIALTFRKFGVYPYPTQNENGGERYMPYPPEHIYEFKTPEEKAQEWFIAHSVNFTDNDEHFDERTIAFHYINTTMMYRLHVLLYNLCPKSTLK